MLGLHFPIRNSKHVCVYLIEQVVDQLEKSWSLTLSVWWYKMSIVDMQYGNRLVCSQMTVQNKTINSKLLSSSTTMSLDPNTLQASLPPQSTSVASSSYRTSSQLWDIACSILYLSMSSEQPFDSLTHSSNKMPIFCGLGGDYLPFISVNPCWSLSAPMHCLP